MQVDGIWKNLSVGGSLVDCADDGAGGLIDDLDFAAAPS